MVLEVVCGGSMQVGDLVRYNNRFIIDNSYGIIIKRDWSGTTKIWVVEWMNGVRSCYPERYLKVIK